MTPHTPEASNGPLHTAARALTARLQAVFPPARFQHELVPAPLNVQQLGALAAVRTPLVALAWLGLRPAPNSDRVLEANLRWGLYLVTRNPKAEPRLLGDALSPGLAQMAHAAILGLQGWIIGGAGDAGIGAIKVTEVENTDGRAWEKDDNACAALTLEMRASFTGEIEDRLLTLAGQWTFDGTHVAATDTLKRNAE